MVGVVTEIGEKIKVKAVFSDGHLRPETFVWQSRRYEIKKIFGAYHDRIGQDRRFHYAVNCGGEDVFELTLDTKEMDWELERVHTPG